MSPAGDDHHKHPQEKQTYQAIDRQTLPREKGLVLSALSVLQFFFLERVEMVLFPVPFPLSLDDHPHQEENHVPHQKNLPISPHTGNQAGNKGQKCR